MIKTGSEDLNKFLEGYKENGITAIYGEAGSGKTTLCLLASLEQALNNKKVIFLDAEINFSTERLNQLLENKNKDCIKNILVLKIKNFNLQHTKIKNLENVKNVSLIVIDSLTHYFRRLYRREPEVAKGMLAKQLSILNKIAKSNIPILITSQVYSSMENEIIPLGYDSIKKFSSTIIKLEKNPRKIKIESPNKKETNFKIISDGIKVL